ncbi:unnamed protein product [Caenorhabditis auriculariae]|uniref:Uncharacterized protein n=1 Tax=Caenorhabditis auriculariae TaxID=2777116 RepID=A0A8S1HB39_9PELO|nr:unnamed protein product [Caenorhabditis auriculariae]
MLPKILLVVMLSTGVLSLKCAFEAKSSVSSLDIGGGVDKCQNGDDYCVRLSSNGVSAKGCSKTAGKISGQGVPTRIDCLAEDCLPDGSLCCCKGDMCNTLRPSEASSGTSRGVLADFLENPN